MPTRTPSAQQSVCQFAEVIVLRDGSPALLRAIQPDDRERLQTAFLALEPESVYLRYFTSKHKLTEADLDRLCQPDFVERVVLLVTVGSGAGEIIVGSGGYVTQTSSGGARSAELAFAVADKFQGQGFACKLLGVLTDIARQAGIQRFDAVVLAQNAPMLKVLRRSGLPICQLPEKDGVVSLTLALIAVRPDKDLHLADPELRSPTAQAIAEGPS